MQSIIEFAEQHLTLKLYPVQKVILKMIYGEALDTQKKFRVPTSWQMDKYLDLTEAEYVQHLYDEGRCSHKEPNPRLMESALVAGRRSGKSLLAVIAAAYEREFLLSLGDPFKRYGVLGRGHTLGISVVGCSKDQADLLKREYQSGFDGNLKVPVGEGFIQMGFFTCASSFGRGMNNFAVIFDEADHFRRSWETCAEATPSLSNFMPRDPNAPSKVTGPVESRFLAISSPLPLLGEGAETFMHSLFSSACKSGSSLAIQIPTWEMNPAIPVREYQRYYDRSPVDFYSEFGAHFIRQTNG